MVGEARYARDGKPQVEERVEGWHRGLEPPRVYLICERLPPPRARVSITPVLEPGPGSTPPPRPSLIP